MDCQMPDMDGLTAAKTIREEFRNSSRAKTPIVAVTASALEEDRKLARASGMDDLLSKPFTDEQLAEILDRWTQTGQVARDPKLAAA
jgi:CheY-like chemotaxis protein